MLFSSPSVNKQPRIVWIKCKPAVKSVAFFCPNQSMRHIIAGKSVSEVRDLFRGIFGFLNFLWSIVFNGSRQ